MVILSRAAKKRGVNSSMIGRLNLHQIEIDLHVRNQPEAISFLRIKKHLRLPRLDRPEVAAGIRRARCHTIFQKQSDKKEVTTKDAKDAKTGS